jgi:hypothetical protein
VASSLDAQIIEGDCRDVLPGIDPATVALVLTDPPYGINERTDRLRRKRGERWPCHDFPPIHGDDAPFNPTPLLRFPRLVLFGANYYADRLPPSPSWLIWDKLAGLTTAKREIGFNDQADVEMAWTNLGGPARLIPQRWMGVLRMSEHGQRRVHPTQKPIALMARIIQLYTDPGDLILDPYAGSGSVGVACVQTGRRFLGVEIVPEYAAVARARLEAAQPALAAV